MTVNLTYAIREGMAKYPSDPDPTVSIKKASVQDGKILSSQTELNIRSHHGTHIDAPAHKMADGKTIGKYGVSKFINNACLVDLAELTGDYVPVVTLGLVKEGFSNVGIYGLRDLGAIVFRTGFDYGSENFPYFEPDAAEYVAQNTLNIVGVDSFSLDLRGSNSESHLAFLQEDILVLETLANLDCLSQAYESGPFVLYSLPIEIKGADAAPVKAFAAEGELFDQNGERQLKSIIDNHF